MSSGVKIRETILKATYPLELKLAFRELYLEFINFNISTDDFSYFCGQILAKLTKMERSEDRDDLLAAVTAGDELDWYLRQPNVSEKTAFFLTTIHIYGQKLTE